MLLNKLNSIKDVSVTNDNYINITQEYYKYNLEEYIYSKQYSYNEANLLFVQILDALTILMNMGYCHGDLSSKNIMISETGTPILIDLAYSRKYRRKCIKIPSDEVCPYEIYNKTNVNKKKIDIWALGCIYYFIHFGHKLKNIHKNITNKLNKFKQENNIHYNTLSKMLNIKHKDRLTLGELYNEIAIKNIENKAVTVNIEQYNVNQAYNKCTNILLLNNRIELINLLIKLCKTFKQSNETIIISIHIIDSVYKKIYIDDITLFIVCYVISCKIVNDFNIDVVSINMLLEKYNSDLIDSIMLTQTIIDICNKISWDIDPNNSYDYQSMMSRSIFSKLNSLFILSCVNTNIIKFDMFTRTVALYVIVRSLCKYTIHDKFNNYVRDKIQKEKVSIIFIAECTKRIIDEFLVKYAANSNNIRSFVDHYDSIFDLSYLNTTYNYDYIMGSLSELYG